LKNRYYIQQVLGQGVEGKVLSAYDYITAKKVAIKILDKKTKELDQFKREIKVYHNLNNLAGML
jgi:serine/threonine protein kinase